RRTQGTDKVRGLPGRGVSDAIRRVVSGRRNGDWCCDSQLSPFQSKQRWGAPAVGSTVADRASEICSDHRSSACFLAGLQRGRLSQSAGICQRAVLGESDRAENRNSKSGKGKPAGCGIIFCESGGTECG